VSAKAELVAKTIAPKDQANCFGVNIWKFRDMWSANGHTPANTIISQAHPE